MQRLLAIDPGEIHCGTALYLNGECSDVLEISPESLFLFVEVEPLDIVVMEEFRLYPDKAAVQGYSQLKTVEVIGVVRYLCEREKITLVEQGASIKKIARAQMAARHVENRAVTEKAGGHCADAVLHGWYYLNKKERT